MLLKAHSTLSQELWLAPIETASSMYAQRNDPAGVIQRSLEGSPDLDGMEDVMGCFCRGKGILVKMERKKWDLEKAHWHVRDQ